jgi:hypothetical protein
MANTLRWQGSFAPLTDIAALVKSNPKALAD